ncbi:hypothetical protein [Methylobacterium brachiatum]|uniref:hypothetical protein n=1 Tax=Methylobacterium brachiatum TaxID=269660 RepID=UPI000EFA7474|nr:hypothetical protein [Methylobacterium brachiatum]AYO85364.1 hypothetical protein EBB05_26165 [Methylobacterium brachiatum]
MAGLRTFETSTNLSFSDGGDREFTLRLGYRFTPGYPASRDEPECPDTVEIITIRLLDLVEAAVVSEYDVPIWMERLIDADEALIASLIADARESDAAERDEAAERRADEARHDRLVGAA